MKKCFAYTLFLLLSLVLPMQTSGQTISCVLDSQEVMSCADSCAIVNCDTLCQRAALRCKLVGHNSPPRCVANGLDSIELQYGRCINDSLCYSYCAKDTLCCAYSTMDSLCCAGFLTDSLCCECCFADSLYYPCLECDGFCCCMQDTIPRRSVMAFKTNLLYDALTLLNISLEVPLGNRFSMLAYYQFPWWRAGKADNEYCLRFLSLGAEARWWFALRPKPATIKRQERDRFVGHFLGVYAESGKWDFEYQRKICHQGEFWSAGLSYGYSVPVGRRMNMEFSFSVGYASIPYRGFTPSDDYEILWRDHDKVGCWSYFGPTKAQISLVMPIKAKKDNKKEKGGRR